jgi:hypothetical protein
MLSWPLVVLDILEFGRALSVSAMPALLQDVLAWIRANPGVLATLVFGSLGLFVGTLLVVPVLIARMRADHFMWRKPPPDAFLGRHPMLRWFAKGLKNLVGVLLVLMGIAMLVLPGQGVLTILIGLSLVDFPGKRKLELRIVRQKHVRRSIDWIRGKAEQPPLSIPEDDSDPVCGDARE